MAEFSFALDLNIVKEEYDYSEVLDDKVEATLDPSETQQEEADKYTRPRRRPKRKNKLIAKQVDQEFFAVTETKDDDDDGWKITQVEIDEADREIIPVPDEEDDDDLENEVILQTKPPETIEISSSDEEEEHLNQLGEDPVKFRPGSENIPEIFSRKVEVTRSKLKDLLKRKAVEKSLPVSIVKKRVFESFESPESPAFTSSFPNSAPDSRLVVCGEEQFIISEVGDIENEAEPAKNVEPVIFKEETFGCKCKECLKFFLIVDFVGNQVDYHRKTFICINCLKKVDPEYSTSCEVLEEFTCKICHMCGTQKTMRHHTKSAIHRRNRKIVKEAIEAQAKKEEEARSKQLLQLMCKFPKCYLVFQSSFQLKLHEMKHRVP